MPSQLTVTTELIDNHWEVTASVNPGGVLPEAIFAYVNRGDDGLGEFYGTASLADLTRMQIWQEEIIPVFGNKFILHTQAKIIVDKNNTPASVTNALVANVTKLSTELQSVSTSTQIINIP